MSQDPLSSQDPFPKRLKGVGVPARGVLRPEFQKGVKKRGNTTSSCVPSTSQWGPFDRLPVFPVKYSHFGLDMASLNQLLKLQQQEESFFWVSAELVLPLFSLDASKFSKRGRR